MTHWLVNEFDRNEQHEFQRLLVNFLAEILPQDHILLRSIGGF